tara:strand:- start:4823 stop:5740 length:918 start_codon:yes stop_codon:yes gene_type:complete
VILHKKTYLFGMLFILIISGCSDSDDVNLPSCKALLATNFKTLQDFKSAVDLSYSNDSKDSCIGTVNMSYKNQGQTILSVLSDGITQGDITDAHKGSLMDKVFLAFQSPYAVFNRNELSKIFMLARRRPAIFGDDDVAFYDLALASMQNIKNENHAFRHFRDSLEKGYINTFNHITAQALITAIYNEDIAHFVASVHERHHMQELVSGKFSEAQLKDTVNFPTDNYVDIINNEIGQELGKYLKIKYAINNRTQWTPNLTSAFLNDIQDYYAQSFDIEIEPYKTDDSLIYRFSQKIEIIKKSKSYL